jgi:hypothetical protein
VRKQSNRLLENLEEEGRIILKFMLKKFDGKTGTGFIWLRIRTNGGLS